MGYKVDEQFIMLNSSIGCLVSLSVCSCSSPHLLSLVLAGLEYVNQPLQLVGRVGRVHHQPEILPGTEVHVEGHHPETRLNPHRVKSSVSESERTDTAQKRTKTSTLLSTKLWEKPSGRQEP